MVGAKLLVFTLVCGTHGGAADGTAAKARDEVVNVVRIARVLLVYVGILTRFHGTGTARVWIREEEGSIVVGLQPKVAQCGSRRGR